MKRVWGWTGILSVWGLNAFAGGIASGGGGITNPNPVSPRRVENAVSETHTAIRPWLNFQKEQYLALWPEDRPQSPLHPLFGEDKDVFGELDQLTIELRDLEPCYDSNQLPVDGSVQNVQPHSICISSFSIAPKVNEFNVEPETAALIVHEVSHLLGANEVEANQIQREALRSFHTKSFSDMSQAFATLLGRDGHSGVIGKQTAFLIQLKEDLKIAGHFRFNEVMDWLTNLKATINPFSGHFTFLSNTPRNLIRPQWARAFVMQRFMCTQMLSMLPEWRLPCQGDLQTIFGAESSATARVVFAKIFHQIVDAPEFEQVVISRPAQISDLNPEMDQLISYVTQIKADIVHMQRSRFPSYHAGRPEVRTHLER